MSDPVAATLRKHFNYSFDMLDDALFGCPDFVWDRTKDGLPYWQILLHVITGMHYWLRLDDQPFDFPFEERSVSPDLNALPEGHLSKDEMKEYYDKVRHIIQTFFNRLTDETLVKPAAASPDLTTLDVVLSQMRHIQHHVGACNTILKENGVEPVGWKDFFLEASE